MSNKSKGNTVFYPTRPGGNGPSKSGNLSGKGRGNAKPSK